jgi:DNA-binding MarR family transcriptional regulator
MTDERRETPDAKDRLRAPGAAFLLSQLGFHVSRLWKERLEPLGVDARQVSLLREIAAEEGRSQHALGRAMRVPASRMVALIDEMEHRGLVQRRPSPVDRRARALYLTARGRAILRQVMAISIQHESSLLAGLEPKEQTQLTALLGKVAASQDLLAGIHPGVGTKPSSPETG